jgi:N-acetylneuraminate synthase
MKINGRTIGGVEPPYIVAEISGNHCGKLENAKRLIKAAKRAGANAVKTQCYEPDTITLNCNKLDFIVQDGLWRGKTLYDLYTATHTPFAWHKDLYSLAKDEDITIFSSVFDKSSIDYLESLDCPAYKIASFEIIDLPLIEYAAQTGKPLIISTGLAKNSEITEANQASGEKAAFLHCTSEYPGTVENADLSRMSHLDNLLGMNNPIGISDHTIGNLIPIAATALKATIIEKHLKLAFHEGGFTKSEDDTFSMEPLAFKAMIECTQQVHEAIKRHSAINGVNKQFRRSLYVVADIKEGESFTTENVRSIRPGFGASPSMLPRFLGKKARKDFRRGDPLTL